jgi:hypothetical protein
MPFLKRGKARYERKRFVKQEPTKSSNQSIVESAPVEIQPSAVEQEKPLEEEKVAYQPVNYRVPKEERLLDLPLEKEVPGEDYVVPEEASYNIMPVGNPVPIGVALKKKRRN